MVDAQNGSIARTFRSMKRSRVSKVDFDIQIKKEERSRSSSPLQPAQFAASFVDSFRYAGPSTRTKLERPAKTEIGEAKVTKEEELVGVPDYVKEDVDVLIIGSNPGRMSSQKSQHFAHPSNHFYRTLHGSGLTPTLVPPSLDYTMLDQEPPHFSIGLTNLAARPTRMAHELDKAENAQGALILLALIRRYRPRVGVFIGMGVARAFEQSLHDAEDVSRSTESDRGRSKRRRCKIEAIDGKPITPEHQFAVDVTVPIEVPETSDKDMGFGVGLMAVAVKHDKRENDARPSYTLLFASPSTSGRVTSHQLPQKTECMRRVRILTEHLTASTDDNMDGDTATKRVSIRLV